jgi:hypothetical protein
LDKVAYCFFLFIMSTEPRDPALRSLLANLTVSRASRDPGRVPVIWVWAKSWQLPAPRTSHLSTKVRCTSLPRWGNRVLSTHWKMNLLLLEECLVLSPYYIPPPQEKQGDIAFCAYQWTLKSSAPSALQLLGKDPECASQRIVARHIKGQL